LTALPRRSAAESLLKDVAEVQSMSLQGDSSPSLNTRMTNVRISIPVKYTNAHSTVAEESLTRSGDHAVGLPWKRHPFSESIYMGADRVVVK